MKTAVKWAGALGLVGIGIFAGCGGGGSSGGGSSSTVSAESIAIVADKIAQISGCEKVPLHSAPLFGSVQTQSKAETLGSNTKTRSYNYDYNKAGSCGGSVNISGTHNNGTDTITSTYSDHCSQFQDRNLVANGKTSVVHKGNPSDYGPIVYETTISTKGDMTGEFVEKNRALPATYKASLQGYSIKFSNGNRNTPASATSPNKVSISSAYAITEGGDKYSVSHIKADTYMQSRVVKVVHATGTYTDPEVGTYTLETNGLDIPINSDALPTWIGGEIKITGGDKSTGTIKATANGVITITSDNNASAGKQIDCTQFVNDLG